jgi:lipopolysaccharide/colanic/teichoic acid biosynthesis glycosyltransferase
MEGKHKTYGPYEKYFKRPLDVFSGLVAVIVFWWLYLILIILGAIFMRGNPFFTQDRPGKNEKIFKLIKFRTMDNRKDKDGNLLPDEVRLNKYGRILRKTSLDEIPEVLNILKGDLSIVGPRPLLPRDVENMNIEQRQRHTVRPGLTGLAQCNGRNSLNWDIKLATDVKYVNNISFAMDLSILLQTIIKVLKSENVEYDEGTDMDLKEWNELKKRKENQNGVENFYTKGR